MNSLKENTKYKTIGEDAKILNLVNKKKWQAINLHYKILGEGV